LPVFRSGAPAGGLRYLFWGLILVIVIVIVFLLLVFLLVVVLRRRLRIDEIAAKMETEMMGGFRVFADHAKTGRRGRGRVGHHDDE
jgi:uncharacterized membrane protein YjjP (DUF1212 family)